MTKCKECGRQSYRARSAETGLCPKCRKFIAAQEKRIRDERSRNERRTAGDGVGAMALIAAMAPLAFAQMRRSRP